MQIDPIVAALAGTISTMAVVIFRLLMQRAERCEAEAVFWRDKALLYFGMADMAVDEAKKRGSR